MSDPPARSRESTEVVIECQVVGQDGEARLVLPGADADGVKPTVDIVDGRLALAVSSGQSGTGWLSTFGTGGELLTPITWDESGTCDAGTPIAPTILHLDLPEVEDGYVWAEGCESPFFRPGSEDLGGSGRRTTRRRLIGPCEVRAVALVHGLRAEGDWLEVAAPSEVKRRVSLQAPRLEALRPLTDAELLALEDRLKSHEATLDNVERLLGVHEGRIEPNGRDQKLLDAASSRMPELLRDRVGPMRAEFQQLEDAVDEAWAVAGRRP